MTTSRSRVALFVGLGLSVLLFLLVGPHSQSPLDEVDAELPSIPWYSSVSKVPPNRPAWIPGKGQCKKTLLIKLEYNYGFGSSLMLLVLPGLSLAKHYGYTPLIDDRDFNYGRVTDYFEPMQLDCDPGEDWATRPRVHYHREGWESADHIEMYRVNLVLPGGVSSVVDEFWTGQMMRLGQSASEAEIDSKALVNIPYLPSEMSFSQAVRPSFRAIFRSTMEFFTLNRAMQVEIDGLVKLTRPARRAGIPVLGAVIRLGDKRNEAEWNLGANAYENWHGYATVLREQAALLPKAPEGAKPLVIVMSDDVHQATTGLKAALGEHEFDVWSIDSEVDVVDMDPNDDRYEALDDDFSVETQTGHQQGTFNSLPLPVRIARTRTLIRDMWYLSRHTDSIVVSSSSNVGRIMLILAGEEKAYGSPQTAPGDDFASIGGLSRSLDTPWFPCVFYVGCFQKSVE